MQVTLRPTLAAGPALGQPSAAPPLRRLLERMRPGSALLVRNRPLRLMFFAGLVSGFGDRLSLVAMAALILARTDSMLHAGLAFVVSTLPYVLFGLFAGTLVDRWDRRRCMVGADLVRIALVALIPFAAEASLTAVYALLFAATCAKMVFTPAQQAAVPDLVAKEDLLAANAAVRTGQYMTDVIGYPLAGALVAGFTATLGPLGGPRLAFGVDAASFAISALLLWQLPAGRSMAALPGGVDRFWSQVTAGARFLLSHPAVRANTILLTVAPLLLGSLHTLHVGYAWRVADAGAAGYGVIQSAMGAGVLLALWTVRPLASRMGKGRVILAGFAAYGLSVLLTGLTDSLLVAALLAAANGAANILFIIPSVTLVQQETPPELRGRVFGVRSSLTYAAFAASNAVVGGLLDPMGVQTMMVLLGAGVVLMAAISSLFPSVRKVA
jgi:MFS family permease